MSFLINEIMSASKIHFLLYYLFLWTDWNQTTRD